MAKRSEEALRGGGASIQEAVGVAGARGALKGPQLHSGADSYRATVRKRGGRLEPREWHAAAAARPPSLAEPGRAWPSLAESDHAGTLLAREGGLHDHLLSRHLCRKHA